MSDKQRPPPPCTFSSLLGWQPLAWRARVHCSPAINLASAIIISIHPTSEDPTIDGHTMSVGRGAGLASFPDVASGQAVLLRPLTTRRAAAKH
jgi:hypothetical protein